MSIKKHNPRHLLQKLYNREVWSSFFPRLSSPHNRARQLFRTIPDRLMFYLRDILQQIGNHVLMGTTQCGQFLITYSYETEQQTDVFKYRLHWWAFRPGAPAYKVAEVQLFDNHEISSALTIGIAQWPNVNNRLVAYGFCHDDEDEEQEEGYVECRRYYLTVTTLPSLHNCKDCRLVAASFDEEEMAANWDSCISVSCLKHGFTVHSFFEVAPPYPPFDIKISLKSANCIIINTGNFLHVLTIDLENPNLKVRTECDSIVAGEIRHRVEEPLTQAGLYYVSPWSIDVTYKMDRSRNTHHSDTTSESGSDVMDTSPRDQWLSEAASLCLEKFKPMWTKRIPKLAPKPPTKKTIDWLTKITDQAEKAYAFKESDDGCEPKFKWYRRRRLADKMYEFCSEDEDMENIQPSRKMPRLRCTPAFVQLRDTFCERITKSKLADNRVDEQQLVSNKDCVQISSPEYEIVDIKPSVSNTCNEEQDSKCVVGGNLTSPYHVLEYQEKNQDGRAVINNIETLSQIVISPMEKDLESCDHRNIISGSDVNNFTLSDKFSGDISLSSTILSSAEVPKNIPANVICSSPRNTHSINIAESVAPKLFTELTLKTDDFTKPDTSSNKVMNPDLKAIIADWEADSLSPSPKIDSTICRTKESKNEVIQRFLELLPKCNKVSSSSSCRKVYNDKMYTQGYPRAQEVEDCSQDSVNISLDDSKQRVSKFPPLRVALRPQNRNKSRNFMKLRPDVQEEKVKPVLKENKVKVQKEMLFGRQIIPGCSVQFDRRYIEEDGEIISITTDIEDDDPGTGYHCALPLSVHGSAYTQMQMITNHKAGKVNVPCGLVRQATLDIEQVCFKAADIICNCEGYKFWFCSDYDIEIIDVCPLNGDILALVCMRVNAEKKYPRPEKKTNNLRFVDPREFYVCQCVFVWNSEQDQCWLEVYSPLTAGPLPSAKSEAALIKSKLPSDSLFTLPTLPPMRSYTHNMWNGDRVLVASLEVMRDHMNLIGFRLRRYQGSVQLVRSRSRSHRVQSPS